MDDLNARLFETTRRLHKGKAEVEKSKNITQMRQYVGSSNNNMFEDSQKTTKDYFRPTHDIKIKDKRQKIAPRVARTYHPASRSILDNDLHRFYSSYGDYCQMCGSYYGSHLRGCSRIPFR